MYPQRDCQQRLGSERAGQELVLRDAHAQILDSSDDELSQANSICEIIGGWGFDGFMRMEIRLEIVYCNYLKPQPRTRKYGPPAHASESSDTTIG